MTTSEQAIECLRQDGPMTAWQLARRQNWPVLKAKQGIMRGRNLTMVRRVGKQPYTNRFIYGAVQP